MMWKALDDQFHDRAVDGARVSRPQRARVDRYRGSRVSSTLRGTAPALRTTLPTLPIAVVLLLAHLRLLHESQLRSRPSGVASAKESSRPGGSQPWRIPVGNRR